MRLPFCLALIGLATACAPQTPTTPPEASAPAIEFLNAPGAAERSLPFSEAVRVGSTLYLSGQIGVRPGTTELVEGGIGPETRQTLSNIQATLERHGASLDRVAKCTVFLADIAEWPAMNEVYTTYFPAPAPARSAVAGSGLALNARVEIECIAVVP
jgi:reactive intermediate/imine deaminase